MQLLPVPVQRASRQMQQVSESELPVPVPQVSAWRPMPVLPVLVSVPTVPVPQVSVKEPQVPALPVSVSVPHVPVLPVSVSVPPTVRQHSLHWQVY